MFRTWIKHIFLFGIMLLTTCAFAQTEIVPSDDIVKASENIVVLHFTNAELQVETKSQLREIKKALNDLITLPVPELRTQRYADYQMRPGQWSIGQLIDAYFLSTSSQETSSFEFYDDSKKEEAQKVLKQILHDVEDSIPYGAGE